jgi:predicted dehydrogenase/threonine dehydrogenase-like Zn-dependent dehydrogenase
MLQLTQNLKTGKMELLEVPFPALVKGYVLVRNHFSLISAGTEGGKVRTARAGYIGKAKEKPEQVKQVLDSIKTDGIIQTYRKVMNKIDAPASLGYSSCGKVIDAADDINEFKEGDYVACGGAGACHAEVISVPKNLCVGIPDNVSFKDAAYATVGSIALQGIRQADLRLGENCVVIGLGLLGQLTIQMLKAAGIKVVGIDINRKMVDLAEKSGADLTFVRDDKKLEDSVLEFTGGNGVDAVIITAGTDSIDPVELAGQLCRKKGKVVVVGAVPTGFSRENYYKKEIELRMSCSYGPGRYDSDYEEKGIDYPYPYVRWTEKRNMEAFLDMLSERKINFDYITTHIFDFESAKKAYKLIIDKSEPFVGILLKYGVEKDLKSVVRFKEAKTYGSDIPNIGFIGAGTFAQKFLLTNAIKYGNMVGVATAAGNETRNIADKYGFQYGTGNADDIINDDNINTIFIATRHNLHAEYVLKGLKKGKNVFVEKPLCMSEQELEEITKVYNNRITNDQLPMTKIMLGFNRRFSPLTNELKNYFKGTKSKFYIRYLINAGSIPKEHWIQDKEIGGGRIIGEVCHFIDLAMFIADSPINSIQAYAMDDASKLMDSVSIKIGFDNGIVASIDYLSNGPKSIRKEKLEVYCAGSAVIIDDFREMRFYGKKVTRKNFRRQDKGHSKEVELFLNSIKNGQQPPIPFEDIVLSTQATFAVIESIRTNKVITLPKIKVEHQ